MSTNQLATTSLKNTEQGVLTPLPQKPLVSIIVVSLNQGAYIKRTIDSILCQDYELIEVVIVDGGSSDNTVEILRGYEDDPRIKWVSESDDGPVDAYNKGMILATGELIGLQNSSDTYEMGVISQAVNEYSCDPLLAMVFGYVKEMDVDGMPLGSETSRVACRKYVTTESIVTLCDGPPFQSSFFRRELALAIGGFEQDLGTSSDYFFFRYMLETIKINGRSLMLSDHWANFRRHPDSLSDQISLTNSLRQVIERRMVCERFSKRFADLLTRAQIRSLLRIGYLGEFKFRTYRLKQISPALPALWGFMKNGGLSQISLVKSGPLLLSFFRSQFSCKFRT